jgi:heme/copper-type cytochrome/quinol oxidase subunit 2
MIETTSYLIAIIFMVFLLSAFKKIGRKNPDDKNLGVTNKTISKIAVIVISICILLMLFVLLKTQQMRG